MFIIRFFFAIFGGIFKLFFIIALGAGIVSGAENLLDTVPNRYHREFVLAAKQTEAHDLGALKRISSTISSTIKSNLPPNKIWW